MCFVNDLLELKDRNLYLMINGTKIPMRLQFYVADEIFFFEVQLDNKEVSTLEELRSYLEMEAEDECWLGDIYTSPMTKIGNCEIRFPKDFDDLVSNSNFDDCYKIERIETTMDDIIIKLK